MSNLNYLNKQLFEALERLNNKDLNGEALSEEINRAHAVGGVASQIINSFALQLKAEMMTGHSIEKKQSEIVVSIEDLNKPRVVRDKNFYKG